MERGADDEELFVAFLLLFADEDGVVVVVVVKLAAELEEFAVDVVVFPATAAFELLLFSTVKKVPSLLILFSSLTSKSP